MANGSPLKVLLVAEGSGGHLIPALQTARSLAAAGARVKMWYALRQQTAALSRALTGEANAAIEMDPIPLERSRGTLERLWRCGQLWRRAERCFDAFAPIGRAHV